MPDPLPSSYTVGAQSFPVDCYGAGGSGRRPVVVIFHGVDGMTGESATEVGKLGAELASDGYIVYVPYYLDVTRGGTALPSRDEMVRRTGLVTSYRPRVSAAVDHALADPNVDLGRFGIVGLSLGGGLALWYAQSAAPRSVKAVVDFFGFISDPAIYANVGKLPPTLVLHNAADSIVPRALSDNLITALAANGIVHDSKIYSEPPYPERFDHTFRPGGTADIDSRARTRRWLGTHL
jgi:dienelactone hydrolase